MGGAGYRPLRSPWQGPEGLVNGVGETWGQQGSERVSAVGVLLLACTSTCVFAHGDGVKQGYIREAARVWTVCAQACVQMGRRSWIAAGRSGGCVCVCTWRGGEAGISGGLCISGPGVSRHVYADRKETLR